MAERVDLFFLIISMHCPINLIFMPISISKSLYYKSGFGDYRLSITFPKEEVKT